AAYRAFFPGTDMPEAKPIVKSNIWLPDVVSSEQFREVMHRNKEPGERAEKNGNILNNLQI
ncbi:MAG: hypothetical protein K6U74_10235, partial [Firmicutes bacterium]|nr:hypothetical protein [Bacillota bacterium]